MKNTCLEPYEFLIDFLADYFGENTEVVLHNLSDLESSIHKIRNGHISGRSQRSLCRRSHHRSGSPCHEEQ
ncbi:PAS domain-containing protein [Salmonella enterica]|uniref:PAS domain-containing protein n=1 Tax=Salmonella enterica TaxID=28901 RepID=UPI0023A9F875|nr:PAS domain-containing protein [Salmonella enterica]